MSALDESLGLDLGSAATNMNVQLLGPVEVTAGDEPVALGGPKERGLLAMLALNAGSTVAPERLIDGLWGDDPPATAPKLVQLYVSHLRKALAASGEQDVIATRGRGYQLQLGRNAVDAARFERLLAQGAAREALSLWRGSPLADVALEPFAAPEIRRLEELRTAALEVAIDQDLDAGRHREVLPELESLLALEPLRERLHAQRMLALYRSGRQAEALEAYRQARAVLVEQVGVEPGPDLRRLQDSILRQDPALDAPADAGARPRSPLFGRDGDLERLRRLWSRARDDGGASVLITGASGLGKTRLARELADEVRREGDVVWCDGAGDPDVALRAAAAAPRVERPTLLVLDDVDRAERAVRDAFGELMRRMPGGPLLLLTTAAEADGIRAGELLALRALEPDAAAALARFHTGARDDGDVPLDRIVAESGGVPGLVGQVAAAWTRAQAMRRVGDAAARTSAGRAEWRLAEDDLATGVVELQDARERAALAAPGRRLPGCPFKGLASFDVEDAGVFFGRERLVADMVARLPGTRLMGVVGDSGSGKSSALRAGLLAALVEGVLPASASWPLALIRPGERPLDALARATRELPARGRWILAVDQFEEVFTVCRDPGERAAFADAIVGCARDPYREALVIVAIRADFYGHCAAYPELSRMLGANHVLVGPMRRHELRRAIELPARRAGLVVEPELVDALVADVEGQPGALPLLSTALLELWQQRDGERLHLAAYERAGGVRGAVARLAESAYERLDPGEREQARRIMLRLAGDGDVRAPVPIGELGDAGSVVDALASERLISVGEDEVVVAHEALLREWPRLRGWLVEDAEGRRLHRHLTHAARDWSAAGRDPSELYRGSRLAAALEWVDAHADELNDVERDFVAASRAAAELEAGRQRRANRRLRVQLAGVAALLAVAVVAGVVAVSQRGEARDAALVADAQRLGAEALVDDRLDRALLLARAGASLDPSAATHGRLLSVLQREPAVLGELRGDGWPLYAVAVSPDERLAAIGDERGGVIVYDMTTRTRVGAYRLPEEPVVQKLVFSPDGTRLAVTAYDERRQTTLIDMLDPRTGRREQRFKLPPFPEETFYVLALVAFQPNGRDLIAQQTPVEFPDAGASVLWRLDAATGEAERPSRRIGRSGAWNLVTTADRSRLFVTSSGDNATYEFAPDTLEVRRTYPVGDHAGAVSADGRMFALGSQRGGVRLLDLETGRVRSFEGRQEGSDPRMEFTPDGRTLVTSDSTGTVYAWDVESGRIRERFTGHTGEPALAVSSDGRTVYSAGLDARMVMWDLAGDRRLDSRVAAGPALRVEDTPKGLALSPDGRTLAVTQGDGTVDLIDARTLERRRVLRAQRGAALAVDFSPDGRLLAVTGEGARVTLWDARTLSRAGDLEGLEEFPYSQELAFSPDGRLLAAGGIDDNGGGRVRVWDVRTGEATRVRFDVGSASLAFSPGGRLLAAAGFQKRAEVRDVRSGRLVKRLETGDYSRSVAFSPDGSLLAVGHYGGSVLLLSTKDYKQVGRRLEDHRARVTALEFSPDGRRLVSASADGTVLLWDVATHRTIGSRLTVKSDTFVAATFARDGSHLFAVPAAGRGVRWDVRPAAWERHACLVAGRELTAREWSDALPERSYRRICD